MSAAAKIDQITEAEMRPVIDSMMELNAAGGAAMRAADVHAATDVTGFGLAGHLHEMLESSNCSAVIDFALLPLFEQVWQLSCDYCRPSRTFSIMDDLEGFIDQGDIEEEEFDNRLGVICDPQTSRLFEETFEELSGRKPARIGYITEGNAGHLTFSDS